MNRLELLNQHAAQNADKTLISEKMFEADGHSYNEVIDYQVQRGNKIDYYNLHGWGYADSGFKIDPKLDAVQILGNRYMFGGQILPQMLPFLQNAVYFDHKTSAPKAKEWQITEPKLNHAFVQELGDKNFSRRSFERLERMHHSHGQAFQETWQLRAGKIEKYCDMVFYPKCKEDVEKLIQLANKHDVMIVPYGGGTNVAQSLMIPSVEQRMVVSCDMTRMSAIKWIDKKNGLACIEAGVYGEQMEKALKEHGVIAGHEPDSMEFSTLGGWISTRASGMKKNSYGNIEDIVLNVTMVTSKGTYEKFYSNARISNGPDLNHLVLGSEGNYGIITDATLKIKPLPEVRIFDSILFHDWESGVEFMHELSKKRIYPTSCRLVDNEQFKFGASLKPASNSRLEKFIDEIKKMYVLKIKGYDVDKLTACTLLFEGSKKEMEALHKDCLETGYKFNGLRGGPENGLRGYLLTFLIAYTRDLALEHNVAGESFELSCPWDRVNVLCERTKARIHKRAKELGFADERVWTSFRVTQLYETGCAVYVYMILSHKGMDHSKIVHFYEEVEDAARDEVLKNGGSISHHHGVGKIRKGFMDRTLPKMAIDWQKDIKDAIDPKNIFAVNNTIYRSDEERAATQKKFDN